MFGKISSPREENSPWPEAEWMHLLVFAFHPFYIPVHFLDVSRWWLAYDIRQSIEGCVTK